MDHYALCLLVPPGWARLDGDETAIAARIDERFSAYALTDEVRASLIAVELETVAQARATGTVLLAAKADGAGTIDDPLSTLSLVVAATPGPPAEQETGTEQGTSDTPAVERSPLRALQQPLFPGTAGVIREVRTQELPAGAAQSIPVFHAQATVVPHDRSMVVTVTVSTTDPARKDEALGVAEKLSSTLRLVPISPQGTPT